MGTTMAVKIQFSDGTFTYLRNDTTDDTLTEITTDASGILNIAGGLSVGQANQGKLAVAAVCVVQEDDSTSGAFSHCAFYGPQGNVLSVIQGGGLQCVGLPRLINPVRMTTGIRVKGMQQSVADGVQIASLAVACTNGKHDIFFGTAVSGSAVSLLNKDGASIGEALTNLTVRCAYATYPSTKGLAEDIAGIGAFYVENSAGQLKMMYGAAQGAQLESIPVPFQESSYPVDQNDTLTVFAKTG